MQIDWSVEIAGLQDLSVTVPRGHQLAADALIEGMKAVKAANGPPADQKVLLAKLAAEYVSSLENLGAFACSIRRRGARGILRRYIGYGVGDVRSFYKLVVTGADLPSLLKLPNPPPGPDRDDFDRLMTAVHAGLVVAAGAFLSDNEIAVRTYYKLKHGFVVVVRLDELNPDRNPPGNWKQDVNVITGLEPDGRVLYTPLDLTNERVQTIRRLLDQVCVTFANLASLILFLSEHGVSLDVST